MASIPWQRQEIVGIVCMLEKELLASFMDLQVHLLIHLPDISWGGLMSLDVLLREVHEKIEGVCSTNGKSRGLYGGGLCSI